MMTRRLLSLLALASSQIACGGEASQPSTTLMTDSAGIRIVENGDPAWSAAESWTIADTPTLIIPSDGPVPEHLPLDPANAFTTASGELVVADGLFNGWDQALVYNSDGEFQHRLGRPGGGPCEFLQVWWASPYRGDSVAVFDYANDRVAIFDSAGDCAREINLPQHAPPMPPNTYGYADGADGIFDDGSVAVSLMGWLDISGGPGVVWYRQAILRVSPMGEKVDSLGIFGISQSGWTGSEQPTVPYALASQRAVHGLRLYEGTGESFEYRIHGEHGAIETIVRRPHTRSPITSADRQSYIGFFLERAGSSPESSPGMIDRMRQRLETESMWPELKPAISALLVDATGHVWVENYRWFYPLDVPPHPAPTIWSVFDPGGRWLGEVNVPGRLLLKTFDVDHVVGIWKLDNGLSEVRVYALDRRGAA